MVDGLPLVEGAERSRMSSPTKRRICRPIECRRRSHSVTTSLPNTFTRRAPALLAGRTFTWHDDKDAPPRGRGESGVCAQDLRLAERTRWADITRCRMERAFRWWALWKTENIAASPKIRSRRCFFPSCNRRSSRTWLVVRSEPRSAATGRGHPAARCGTSIPGCRSTSRPGTRRWTCALFAPRMATMSLGVLGVMGAMLSITGIFGMAAYSVSKRMRELGIRIALGAQRKEVLQAALGRRFQIAGLWFGGGIAPGNSGQPGAGLHRVSGDAARSAGAGRSGSGHVVAGAAGYVDSGATRAVGRSAAVAARGVKRLMPY